MEKRWLKMTHACTLVMPDGTELTHGSLYETDEPGKWLASGFFEPVHDDTPSPVFGLDEEE